jgi:hypothetical protein
MEVHELSRDAAVALDATDPLARFRDRFVVAGDEDLIYLYRVQRSKSPSMTQGISGTLHSVDQQVHQQLVDAVLVAGPLGLAQHELLHFAG